MSKRITIKHPVTGKDMVRAYHARHFFGRLRGLLGKRELNTMEGLLLTPCSQIHTLGMRFNLDVVFIDQDGVIVKCVERLQPFRFAAARGARHTLELTENSVRMLQLKPGDKLTWE